MMGVTQRKWDFFYRASPHTRVCSEKKNMVKIARCSGMSKFCPPAAALGELRQGNKYERM
jgi:hypothetical protein